MSLSRFAALCVSLFVATAPAVSHAKDTLVIGISQFPSTLHPSFDSMLSKEYVNGMARQKLTIIDHDWEIACLLCMELPNLEKGTARFETTPDGADGLAVDYTLRDDAVWGDGTPITTKDVLFTWEVGRTPEVGVSNQELFRRILSIDAHDDKRFTVHLDRRSCSYEGLADFELIPEHIERAAFEVPADYRKRTAYDRDPTNPALWNGPYRVTGVQPGVSITLEVNPRWTGQKPHFNRIIVRAIENTAALTANLLSGDIDMIAGELGLTIDQALSFERRHGDDYQIVYRSGLIYEHIDLNLENPLLQDVRVRRALLHAIDREAMNKQLFDGRQPTAHGGVNPLDSVYYDGVPKYAFDPDRARALLEEAGWTPGPDGVRRNAEGATLRLEIGTTAGNKTRELVQQVLQSQWKDVGVAVGIKNEPARVFFGETVSKRQYDSMAMFAWLSSPQNIPRSTLHSEEIPMEENGWSGQNYTSYRNPRMDEIIDDLELVCEEDANQALWNEMQMIYATDLPALPLYYRAQAHIMPTWLTGLRPTGHQFPSTIWVQEWNVAE
ncbi:MAG: peptide ABC transporter substrate-binding protein [Alphaproteobacteria bacterium]|nr:peptide ABC transporter substrate-binding protein [Alphaproteobacteria bacterium]